MSRIGIQGADPDGNAINLTVDKITQDEPVCEHGKRQPDGAGVGTSVPFVRAERSGKGDGRVYEITFTASDDRGGSCTAAVRVGVPRHLRETATDRMAEMHHEHSDTPEAGLGKCITIYERQPGGAWSMARGIWNSDNLQFIRR